MMSNLWVKVLWVLGLGALMLTGCQKAEVTAGIPTPSPTVSVEMNTPIPIAPLSPTSTTTSAPLELPAVAEGLEGLDIDAFFEASYLRIGKRCPECLTTLGLSAAFGMRDDHLNDMSDAFIRETQALEHAILQLLETYNRDALTPEQRTSYDVYAWYLQDQIRGHEFIYYDYIIRPGVIGYQDNLVQLFTDLHPVSNKQNAEDYVARLWQVETQMQQVVDGLRRRDEIGVRLPRGVLQWVGQNLRRMADSTARTTPFYSAFEGKLQALNNVSAADKEALLQAALEAVEGSVLPGFDALADFVEQQQQRATDDLGVARFPDGEAYYAYLLHHYTTTTLTAGEIHDLGQQELVRIQAEMRTVFEELGYPSSGSLPDLYRRVANDSGFLEGDAILREYEALIAAAAKDIAPAFDLQPQAAVVVIGVPSGGYYIAPAVDGSRPGAFYASNTGSEPVFAMATLAYHEAIPGHHQQIAIAQELPLPFFRKDMSFLGYTEGWALYAERLAWELGFYEDDPYGNLGRLQAEAFRAVRLVVDTGIHVKGWTYTEAVDYMLQNTGMSRGAVESQVWRYITWPGQATAYKTGMLEILNQRQRAMDALGDDFDLRAFHNTILRNGSVPLEILDQIVQEALSAETGK
ncbi:MAG: hypothetical protein BWY63_02611 [Chloroflexi bacterium ADurb.Bin360]|nr:MAG: hypothetical protein BWY63_02611 [Chloroflexi bacterium ADurb.Bin360]